MRIAYRCVILVFAYSLSGVAQQLPPVKTPDPANDKTAVTSTVTGHVYLNDTKAPARKATVHLQPAASLLMDVPPSQGGNGQDKGTVTIQIETLFDGSYSFTHVPSGSYYVLASYPGYMSPYRMVSLAEARSPYGDWKPLGPAQKTAKESVLRSLPRVDVQSGLPASIDVFLERGAAVSGNISYDDGSPAAGLVVNVLARMLQDGKETWAPLNNMSSNLAFEPVVSDDRGNYRISGLLPRKYIVQVSLTLDTRITYISSSSSDSSSSNRSDLLSIYSGSTPRLKDASSFPIEQGEERTGEDLRIPMSKLHTVSGNIVSAHDGHVINSGGVVLLNADDRSVAGQAQSTEEAPGFAFYFIFDGEYILTSPQSADVDYIPMPQPQGNLSPPSYDSHVLHFYGFASKPLHVTGDLDDVTIAVPEPTAEEAKQFKEALRQQEHQNQNGVPR